MAVVVSQITMVLEHVAQWTGFRGAIVFIVDVDVATKSFKIKTELRPLFF